MTSRAIIARMARSSQMPSGPGLISVDLGICVAKFAVRQDRVSTESGSHRIKGTLETNWIVTVQIGGSRMIRTLPLPVLTHAVYKATEMFRISKLGLYRLFDRMTCGQ